ncbi:MAG: primosomal protein N' (replication factor Y) - superfamily II helicase [Pseudomonadota bacterium]
MANFPCADCGAQLTYSPGTARMTCPYCGAENDLPDADTGPWHDPRTALVERDLAETLAALARADRGEVGAIETTRIIRCGACGAEVGFEGGRDGNATATSTAARTLADNCPFCASPLSLEAAHDHRHPAPQGVLPFAIAERAARGALKDWLASRWFAPSDLKKFAEASRPINGVYVPHYTYDALATSDYRGQRGDAYYVTQWVTVTENGKSVRRQRQVRKIRWSRVSGQVQQSFDDVLVPATGTLTEFTQDATVDGHTDWDLDGMAGYNASFLAGFRAEAPSLPLGDGFQRASTAMEQVMRGVVRADIGGDEQRISAMSTRYDRVTFKHVLLPVWLAAYRYRNQPYRVVVNGRTGRVTGERPYSWIKIALAVLAVLLILGVLYLVGSAEIADSLGPPPSLR